jgi:hypothetical protein
MNLIESLIESARTHLGVRSKPFKVNGFGQTTGQNGKAWNGSFLEVVMGANSVYPGTGLTSTVSALAYFASKNRLFSKPRVGDLVFYNWSTDDDGLGQPHIGLVTEVRDYKRLGKFRAIEAETTSGLSKGPQEPDGVYERTRYQADILIFARPAYTTVRPKPREAPDLPALRVPTVQPGKTGMSVELLQSALSAVLNVSGFNRGVFDAHTRSAVAAYQRRIGLVGASANGVPNDFMLNRLARDTEFRYFKAWVSEP